VGQLASQLGQAMAVQLRDIDRRPRDEASTLRARYTKLSKDFREVNQQFEGARTKALARLDRDGRRLG
jgi:hypothetical protein